MRIIDKQNDYYDYLHDYSDTLVFDRRNSYLLTKESIIRRIGTGDDDNHIFLLLQCGATYWLFFVTATKWQKREYSSIKITDYSMEVLATWKDYDKPLGLVKLEQIRFNSIWQYSLFDYNYKAHKHKLNEDEVQAHATDLQNAVKNKDYQVLDDFNTESMWDFDRKKRQNYHTVNDVIPLLKACGIANLVDANTMYYAIDEYFSLMKTTAETTTAKGTTNKDKIVNHGFDTKTSFRGK